ncbi:MAG: Y-family DNA polymerase [candidate division Zixibacteria bacterium]|nr:Y-family DNA polymerase [candidate division Zixibacteria bacterium]
MKLKADRLPGGPEEISYPPEALNQSLALVDCNNFYASCERVFNPKLNGQPIVVLSSNDACIIALSNEAKQFGIKVGEPLFEKRDIIKKNNIVVCSSNFNLYGDMSRRVMDLLSGFISDIEIYSIDEAFLNFSGHKKSGRPSRRGGTVGYSNAMNPPQGVGDPHEAVSSVNHSLTEYARTIRQTIQKWTGIPVSIGLARTKTLTKIASKLAKKSKKANGVLNLIDSPHLDRALEKVHVVDVWGVGIKSARKLIEKGIRNALQLRDASDNRIRHTMGVSGLRLVYELRGISCHALDNCPRPKKGILCSQSFGRKISDIAELKQAITAFVTNAAERLRKQKSAARHLTVFMLTGFSEDKQARKKQSLSIKLPAATNLSSELIRQAMKAVERIYQSGQSYKRAGVRFDDLVPSEQTQISLFDQAASAKTSRLMETVDILNDKLGSGSLRYATQGTIHPWKAKSEMVSPRYTTCWDELAEVLAK